MGCCATVSRLSVSQNTSQIICCVSFAKKVNRLSILECAVLFKRLMYKTVKKININFTVVQFILAAWLTSLSSPLFAQFAGPVGSATSTAVHMNSASIIGWADYCTVERGWMNISDTSLGKVYNGLEVYAIGHADETGVISLGDSGVAVLTFPHPIFNGPGADFVVFENAFSDSFLELGHVEVSSDGINYFRFPSDFFQLGIPQIGAFDQISNASKINNLAGKYRGGYGTPFDLEELTGISGLNINSITHIKIIDVIGSISPSFGSTDQNGNFINDPFPTPFPSGGFDLDAVGVCYFQGVNSLKEISNLDILFYPNPVEDVLQIQVNNSSVNTVEIYSSVGKLVSQKAENEIDLSHLPSGVYLVKLITTDGQQYAQRIIKR